MNNIKIAKEKDIPSINKISTIVFGSGYESSSYSFIKSLMEQDNSYCFVYYSKRNNIIGFCYGKITTIQNLRNKYPGFKIPFEDLNNEDKVSLSNTMAINPKHQMRGFGQALTSYTKEYLNNLGVYQAISPVWKAGSLINAHKLLINNGFFQYQNLGHYWQKECDKTQDYCHFRNDNAPCQCELVFYAKKEL